jgi:AraC-like DNA-binding protein
MMGPDLLDTLDASFSSGLLALLFVLAALALRDGRGSLAGRLLFLFSLSICALALISHPAAEYFAPGVMLALVVAAAPNVGLVWALCVTLLSDRAPQIIRLTLIIAVLSIGPLIFGLAQLGIALRLAQAIEPFGIMPLVIAAAHLGWVALSQYRGDLIESRRKVRLLVVGIMVIVSALSVLSEELSDGRWQAIVRNGIIGLPVCALWLLWLVRLEPERLAFAPMPVRDVFPVRAVDPRDQHVVDQIDRAVRVERAFLDPGLSIERLAQRLDVPVHRLRAIINQALGHRNFASFINGYRVDFAKAALADPARGRETILAVAYEAGFSSLQTFNRVFRDIEDMTPTDYRQRSLGALLTNEQSTS